jgi:prepilin-type N-terminal cleavage/methylation domain-containing protein/prepilin-type processing-associated H-X9-DG protein
MSCSRACSARPLRRGFTVVELLVVVAIIGVLMALLLPAVNAAREAGRRSKCSNNLRQVALGVLNYLQKWEVFPPGEIHGTAPGYGGCRHCNWDAAVGMWMNLIFPHIDLQPAFDKLDFSVRPQWKTPYDYSPCTGPAPPVPDNNPNVLVMQQTTGPFCNHVTRQWDSVDLKEPFSIFLCSSDTYRGLTTPWPAGVDLNRARICNYFAVYGSDEQRSFPHPDNSFCTTSGSPAGELEGPWHCNKHDGMFYNDSAVKVAHIRDGQSNTAMLCEVWGRIWEMNELPPTIPPGCPNVAASRGMNLHAAVYFDTTPNNFLGTPDAPCNATPWKASSFHPGGVNMAYADGSVHFITLYIDFPTFQALATIAGGEATSPPSD